MNEIIIAIISSIISIIGAIYITKRYLYKIKLCFYYENTSEISRLSDDKSIISVYYKKKKVHQITTSKIWIWNKGNIPLRKSDMPESDFLRIKIIDDISKDIKILDYSIKLKSKEKYPLTVKYITNAELLIDYEYIDIKQGFIIEVQHTGGKDVKIQLLGTILGPKDKHKLYKKYEGVANQWNIEKKKKIILIAISIFTLYSFYMMYDEYRDDYAIIKLHSLSSVVTKTIREPKTKEERYYSKMNEKVMKDFLEGLNGKELKSKKDKSNSYVLMIIYIIQLLFLWCFYYYRFIWKPYPKALSLKE